MKLGSEESEDGPGTLLIPEAPKKPIRKRDTRRSGALFASEAIQEKAAKDVQRERRG